MIMCPSLQTNRNFLFTTLNYLDCQGRSLGAYGYGALSDPNSVLSTALTGLLTIFVALFALRLMFGRMMGRADIIGAVLKIGIVLTLTTSWPALRIIGYDVVIEGPTELAGPISAALNLPGATGSLERRLQNLDNGLVAITSYGTGRLTGGEIGGRDNGDSFNGIALADQTGLGWGRASFLIGQIGPYALTRIGSGLLLALTPLMAGLLLFAGTSGLFYGWLRALAFVALSNVAYSIAAGIQVALMVPWVNDVLTLRQANNFTPAAPTELLVLGCAFSVLMFGLVYVIGRLVFHPSGVSSWWSSLGEVEVSSGSLLGNSGRAFAPSSLGNGASPEVILNAPPSRAYAVADAVSRSMRREGMLGSGGGGAANSNGAVRDYANAGSTQGYDRGQADGVSGSRRSGQRMSSASQKRDGQK